MSSTENDPAHPGSAAPQERAATDRGLTGDKVAVHDPAAAPLGTDEEAGGQAAAADAGRAGPPALDSKARDPNRANEQTPRMPWVWILVALIAALLVGVAFMGGLSD